MGKGYQKTQNFMQIANPLEKLQKIHAKKAISEIVTEKWSFLLLLL
jgi:hypothetical protein